MNSIPLPGCTPEPLMAYLKALGVFRLVSQQTDPSARAAWRGGQFVLTTKLNREELAAFFTENYAPSPIFSPWNGDGGFLTESGTSFSTIEAIRRSTDPRLAGLQSAIGKIEAMTILKEFGQCRSEAKALEKKKKAKQASPDELEKLKELTKRVKSLKETILFQIRSDFPDDALGWFDTCLQVGEDGFSVAPALGSGGVDGRMEFSANFLGNVMLVSGNPHSRSWIESSLFAEGVSELHSASIGQFSPGNIGGPNATQGFEGASALNPWDYILLIEGAPLLAGSIARRCRTAQFGKAAFPFTVLPVAQNGESMEAKDSNTARGEVWLPLWEKNLRLAELKRLFGEGRAEWSGSQSRTNIDFAKAVASYGVDRGIKSFSRHGFLQRNGLAFLATPLGHFEVKAQANIDLIRDADPWIDRYRRACGDKTPARFGTALRVIDSAVFDYCRFGGKERFQTILIALGQAERELATGAKFRESAYLRPLRGLSASWVEAADDASPEFEIAVALAGIRGTKGHPLGIRANMEPVAYNNKGGLDWLEGSTAVVWKRGDLATHLAATLERRALDWLRLSLDDLPIRSSRTVRPETIAAFLHGELDDDKIEALLWGLIGCKVEWATEHKSENALNHLPLPRCYPLLKAIFSGIHKDTSIPKGLNPQQQGILEKLAFIKPDTRLLQLLRANRVQEANSIATQRTINAGLSPARVDWSHELNGVDSTRLAAALLLPVSPWHMIRLWDTIKKPQPTFASETT
ncbi:MAG: type I-U CRISPR-associated protein Csx17 [Opitutales bacterium]|nr:type I-U CRISPR-associated protein Csx17 [Opitutales bacterium]